MLLISWNTPHLSGCTAWVGSLIICRSLRQLQSWQLQGEGEVGAEHTLRSRSLQAALFNFSVYIFFFLIFLSVILISAAYREYNNNSNGSGKGSGNGHGHGHGHGNNIISPHPHRQSEIHLCTHTYAYMAERNLTISMAAMAI